MQNCPIISPKKYNIHTKVAHFVCKCATFVIFLQSLIRNKKVIDESYSFFSAVVSVLLFVLLFGLLLLVVLLLLLLFGK